MGKLQIPAAVQRRNMKKRKRENHAISKQVHGRMWASENKNEKVPSIWERWADFGKYPEEQKGHKKKKKGKLDFPKSFRKASWLSLSAGLWLPKQRHLGWELQERTVRYLWKVNTKERHTSKGPKTAQAFILGKNLQREVSLRIRALVCLHLGQI